MAHYTPRASRASHGRSLDELKARNEESTELLVKSLPGLTVKRGEHSNDYFPSWVIRSGEENVGYLTFDNSNGRWTIKGRYFPQVRNQRWGEGSMWRKDLPTLLEAAKPFLRGKNPYEAAREASNEAYERLRDATPEDAASKRYAERYPGDSYMLLNGRLDAALLNMAAAFYTSDAVLTPEEREAFRIRLLKIRRDAYTAAALNAMHEMWLDFDTRMYRPHRCLTPPA